MATSSSAFIAQPNFLAASKRNVFSTKVRLLFFYKREMKRWRREREPQGVVMTCKNKNKNSFSPPRGLHRSTTTTTTTHTQNPFSLFFTTNRPRLLNLALEPPAVEDRSSKPKRFSTLVVRRKKQPGNRWCASTADIFTEVISARCRTRTDARLVGSGRTDSKPRWRRRLVSRHRKDRYRPLTPRAS